MKHHLHMAQMNPLGHVADRVKRSREKQARERMQREANARFGKIRQVAESEHNRAMIQRVPVTGLPQFEATLHAYQNEIIPAGSWYAVAKSQMFSFARRIFRRRAS